MTISSNQIKLLHVAKGKLKLTDEDYRLVLVRVAGVTSSKDLDTPGFDALMGFFEHLGFKPLSASGQAFGARAGMASFAQIELIRTLWSEYTNDATESMLNKWLERTFKVSSLRFVNKATAPKIITALKSMKSRAAA